MMRWWGHLKIKVLAFGIAMSVLPLALFGWYGLTAARSSQLQLVQMQNQAAANLVAEELGQFTRQLTAPLQLVAGAFGTGLAAMDPAGQERVLYALLHDVPHLEEVALAGPDGRGLVRVSRREVTAGRTPPSYADTALWAQVARGAGPALGEVTLDLDGRPLLPVGLPLPDGTGALMARASMRGVISSMAAVRGNRDMAIHVVNADGRVIGDSDFSLVLAGVVMEPLPGGSDLLPYRSVTGAMAVGTAVPVPGLAWTVRAETPLDTAMEPVRLLGWEFGLGALVIMGAVVALSVVFGLQLTEPLERLEAGARRVGAGDLSARIPAGGRDELGRLVNAFNAMTGQLEQSSQALRAERDRLDTVVSAIGAGLALISADGQVLWTNRTVHEWFGDTLVGRPCREALGRDCGGCTAVCSQGGAERAVTLQGRQRLIRYSTYDLGEGRPGEPARLEVLEDVTERRSMEAMVRQSEKLAAVGQLAAGVAHEINNPLAVISAYAEDLNDRLQEEGAAALEQEGALAGYLTQLQVQVRRCKGITTNLLDFARRGSTVLEPVDAADVASQTAALVAPQARRAGVAVKLNTPEGLPSVRATRDQLQQVFLNLITNALDAMEETGPGEITITAEAANDRVHLRVSDTGPGMDAATLDRAMEPFFTTKPPGKGTGLGLSTCYGIITGLGGQMGLTSSPGRGTTVQIELPVWGE